MNDKAYSVSQINAYLKKNVEGDPLLRSVWIEGEIAYLKRHPKGMVFMTLKDAGGQLKAVIFPREAEKIKIPFDYGSRILARGSVRIYEAEGVYQLYVEDIRLSGLGDLYQAFELQKKKMAEKGYFDPSHRKPIPRFALKIGIVTASSGAAIHDIQTVAHRRNPYVSLFLRPAQVQGKGAAESIADAIRYLDAKGLDVIIVGRGGGSTEDLWAFNEEAVVEAVFHAKTPIISAVGHESDQVLSDLAADLRAATPSAATEIAVFDYYDYLQNAARKEEELRRIMAETIARKRLLLEKQNESLKLFEPSRRLTLFKEKLKQFEETARILLWQQTERSRSRLKLQTSELEALSPLKRITAGYAFVEKDNKQAVRSVGNVRKDELLRLYLADGSIISRVEEIIQNE